MYQPAVPCGIRVRAQNAAEILKDGCIGRGAAPIRLASAGVVGRGRRDGIGVERRERDGRAARDVIRGRESAGKCRKLAREGGVGWRSGCCAGRGVEQAADLATARAGGRRESHAAIRARACGGGQIHGDGIRRQRQRWKWSRRVALWRGSRSRNPFEEKIIRADRASPRSHRGTERRSGASGGGSRQAAKKIAGFLPMRPTEGSGSLDARGELVARRAGRKERIDGGILREVDHRISTGDGEVGSARAARRSGTAERLREQSESHRRVPCVVRDAGRRSLAEREPGLPSVAVVKTEQESGLAVVNPGSVRVIVIIERGEEGRRLRDDAPVRIRVDEGWTGGQFESRAEIVVRAGSQRPILRGRELPELFRGGRDDGVRGQDAGGAARDRGHLHEER